jgi:magnesium transporter
MIRSLYRTKGGETRTELSSEVFATVLEDAGGLLWVDFSEEPRESCEPILREIFNFHPLAVDDALEEIHVPKVDDWGHYLYLVLHAIVFNQQSDEPVSTVELDVFLGRNYLVTHHTQAIASVGRVWAACQRNERYLQRGTGHLLYRLADELVADYMPVVEEIDEVIDQIEDRVFDDPAPSILEQIFWLKRALLRLRRITGPQREVFNRLARGDYASIEVGDRVFFRDVYDHLVRLYDIAESLRDLAGSTLDTYLSVINNRMNDVMKALTIITTLFMPLSFLSGFFGMNFFQPVMPLESWTGGLAFGLTLAAMALLPIGMYLWMQRRAWM